MLSDQTLSALETFVSRTPDLAPWSPREFELILGAAGSLPDIDCLGVPARLWWPAVLLVIVDTQLPPAEFLDVLREDYDAPAGRLTIGQGIYRLHPLTVAAIDRLLPALHADLFPRLFPWPHDRPRRPGAKRTWKTFRRHLRTLLFFTGLPNAKTNPVCRLIVTGHRQPDLLHQINPDISVRPVIGRVVLSPRRYTAMLARDRSLTVKRDASATTGARQRQERKMELYRLALPQTETLRQFFDAYYAPRRLADGAPETIKSYRGTIERLSWFLACDATPANLNDDTVERFLVSLKASGLSNPTVNRFRRELLALWRYAWKKRRVKRQPRDILRLKEPKRLPEAWSVGQMSLILASAAAETGLYQGNSAGEWWVALILVLFDSGLRIDAAILLKRYDFDLTTRMLTVAAETQKQLTEQTFKLHPDTCAALARLGPANREFLLPSPYKYCGLRNKLRRILLRAGLPARSRDMFHRFRRTSATQVAAVSGERAAQRHLGHSNLEVTRRYIDPRYLPHEHDYSDQMSRPEVQVAPLLRIAPPPENETAAAS